MMKISNLGNGYTYKLDDGTIFKFLCDDVDYFYKNLQNKNEEDIVKVIFGIAARRNTIDIHVENQTFLITVKLSKCERDRNEFRNGLYYEPYKEVVNRLYSKYKYKNDKSHENLINLLTVFTLDDVENKSKEEMPLYKRLSENPNDYNRIMENYKTGDNVSDEKKSILEEYISTAKEMYDVSKLMGCFIKTPKDENKIYICDENIKEFSEKSGIKEDTLKKLVFAHEIGHLVFSYVKDDVCNEQEKRELHEKQANYIASYVYSEFKEEIKRKTGFQPEEYKKPYLYKDVDSGFSFTNTKKLFMGKLPLI